MDIVLRAAVVYLFLWIVLRSLGKRELGELTPFDLVLLMTIGDLVQQGVTQEDFSITGAMLAVGTFVVLTLVTSYASFKWKATRPLFEGLPAVVVLNGKMEKQAMKLERLAADELLDAARQQGIQEIAEIRYGILEPDGKFSFIKYSGEASDKEKSERRA
jgi:uncharacterized membrane protein YcaP (DUF421 family)